MGRDRGERRRSSRRGRRSDPRLRGLSYEERRRVYLRRRIVALLALGVLLLLVIGILAGLTPLFGGAGADDAPAENASRNTKLESPAVKPATAEPEPPAKAEPPAEAESVATKPGPDALDVLVLGVDRRPEESVEGSRADTVMLMRVLPASGEVRLLSIPRDLFVEIEPGVEDRINAAYSAGGVEQTTWAVEKTTGVSVDRHAVVDFEGFEDIVDAVGGVTVDVRGEMPPGRNLEGTETLSGEQALFYARYRGTPGGDLDRIARQQQVVNALRESLVGWGALSKLPGITEAIHGNLETNLGLAANISLARSLLNAEDAGSAFTPVQLAGEPTFLPDGRQVLVPDPAQNEPILQEFRGEETAT